MKALLPFLVLLLSTTAFGQYYTVKYARIVGQKEDVLLIPSDHYVVMGTSYLFLSAKTSAKKTSDVLYKYYDLRLEYTESTAYSDDPILNEVGFGTYFMYTARDQQGMMREVIISVCEDEPTLKYIILQIGSKMYIHAIIQEL